MFTVCNAHGGGGDEEKPQEMAAGAMDGVLGPGFWVDSTGWRVISESLLHSMASGSEFHIGP